MQKLNLNTINLLRKEAFLANMNLGVGLTFMRKYDPSQLGFFYQGMFSLSIGIERLMKLILIYEEITSDNKYNVNPKKLGHNLNLLYKEAEILGEKYGVSGFFQNNIKEKIPLLILDELNKFSDEGGRYFHLDGLKGVEQKSRDPIIEWNDKINVAILEKHKSKELSPENLEAIEILNHWMTVRSFDEKGNIVKNYKDLYYNQIRDLPIKQKYGMYYSFFIIKALCELQKAQSWKQRTNIDLSEFFTIFRLAYSDAKKRKSWNPSPPYKF